MKTKELKQSNTYVDLKDNSNSNSSTELIKREQIPNSPFMAIWTERNNWFAVLGKHRITEYFETKDELLQEVQEKNWNLIINVLMTIQAESEQIKEWNKEITQ